MHKPYDTHLVAPADKSEHIRILNDALRTEPLSVLSAVLGRTFVFTKGIAAQGDDIATMPAELKRAQETATRLESELSAFGYSYGGYPEKKLFINT